MTARPVRLQLNRRAGFNLQQLSHATNGLEAVNVARPGKWGNPHRVGWCFVCGTIHTLEQAIAEFVAETNDDFLQAKISNALRGKNLGCWCRLDHPCHANRLLKIANR